PPQRGAPSRAGKPQIFRQRATTPKRSPSCAGKPANIRQQCTFDLTTSPTALRTRALATYLQIVLPTQHSGPRKLAAPTRALRRPRALAPSLESHNRAG